MLQETTNLSGIFYLERIYESSSYSLPNLHQRRLRTRGSWVQGEALLVEYLVYFGAQGIGVTCKIDLLDVRANNIAVCEHAILVKSSPFSLWNQMCILSASA